MNKLVSGLLLMLSGLLMLGFGMAADGPSYCCERTTEGAWCVNDVESACDVGYNVAPTSCESTSYCRTGTCYESEEGICMANTPQRVCNDNGGTWDAREVEDVPQCQLGCCLIADQAAFVPLVRCKKLSTFFGVENNYRTDVADEVSCIALANAQDVGACVYEREFERVCDFTTRAECGAEDRVETLDEGEIAVSSGKTFYEDYLCSAEELSTSCARQTTTMCYRDDVYWVDSCGNRENVYSSDKARSWNNGRVLDADDVCPKNAGTGAACGNCDYLLGSRCAKDSGFGVDHYCQRTECIDRNGDERINGESWCVVGSETSEGDGHSAVGSRYYREICSEGVVRVEPCADYRNEICIDGLTEISGGTFQTAACRVNRWQECNMQTEEDDCLNIDQRDCRWVASVKGMALGDGAAICVPNFPPGLAFWEGGSATEICAQASASCTVVYEKGLLDGGDWDVEENGDCLDKAWAEQANAVCTSLGDCGGAVNYAGAYSDDGYKWVQDGTEMFL